MGFSIVFTLLGAASGTWVPRLRAAIGRSVAGMVVVAVGVLLLGSAIGRGPRILFVERRPWLERVRPSKLAALPLGMAFAAGWTPCIGPVLAAILGLARADSGDPARGALLLFLYSMGLGVPFLLIGLGVERFMGAFGWVKRNYRWIAGVSGVL